MSKKRKGSPVAPVTPSPSRLAKPQPAAEPVSLKSQPVGPVKPVETPNTEQPFDLIRFDRRVKWFLGICLGLFLLLSLAKIHAVSIPIWNQMMPDGSDAKRGVISGESRRIRMDDYAVMAPWILSQTNRGLPQENETIGGGKAPVLVTPTNHFSTLFRADYWGFFFLNAEQGYAWAFNFRAILSLIGATLLLLLLTQNNFWLSLFGSTWLFLSSGTQSWTHIPTVMIGSGSLAVVAAIYLCFGKNKRQIIIASIGLCYMVLYYAFILYPPYQVPLGYVFAALFLGYLLTHVNKQHLSSQWQTKIIGAISALAGSAVIFYLYFTDLKPTIDAITNTVYPGKRSELGGTGFIANWFSEYFSWQFKDTAFPGSWLNHCELSHYITFAPIIIPSLILVYVLTRQFDWTLLLLSVFVVAGYIWIEVGFPAWLAKLTLWNMSPTRRMQIPFGIGNVLLSVLYLHYLTTVRLPRKNEWVLMAAVIIGVIGFVGYAVYVNVNDSDGFFKAYQLFLPAAFFAGLGILLLPTWQPSYRTAIFGIAILFFLSPNLRLNPVSKGLTPITEHVLYKAVRDIQSREPEARWVVFGGQFVSYMVTATGVNLLSGVKYTPPRQILRVLDPQAKRDSAYNRYAHTVYSTYINPQKPDSVIMVNTFEDGYTVAMDPCSPRFKKLNVKYIIFDRQPQPVETRCMKLVSSLGSLQIYRIND
ncbi:DUF7657 domain-containing protein [Spirosoma montaniterrae]|uniref:Glycosyltransferase RgtA/B/C/D-like domain-containing protein n=1 Tax=Spirosoma montaniterrae TaxID=1178516 RepID=A0A1P9X1R9_9BACT|nr:hypothetical protein [Spirosoma montaniterrae]AQG81582.1 hypothetical protein AWR27_21085 [Spirosoma montaniterrae]